jgi:hypothetical protein
VTRDAEDLFNAPGPVRIEEQRQAARDLPGDFRTV